MALRFIDSFDHYDTADLTRKWSSYTGGGLVTVVTTDPRNGIQCLKAYANYGPTKVLDDQATWVVGFGFKIDTLPDSLRYCLSFSDAITVQVQLGVNGDGTLEIRRDTTAVTDGKSSLTINANTWYFIEMKVTIANSIGASTCIVKVNGTTFITVATGQDLQVSANATANSVEFISVATYTYFDDVYICDGTGGVNDDILGECRVECRMPDGNGTTNNWTGSDADSTDNYLHVDEVSPDDDTSYVEDSTPANQDLYAVEDLSITPTSIFGVQTNIMAEKDDAGARSVMGLVRSGGTTYDGDTNALSQSSYSDFTKPYDVNPDTSAAWTESNFNSAEFGVETV